MVEKEGGGKVSPFAQNKQGVLSLASFVGQFILLLLGRGGGKGGETQAC